GGQRHPQRDRTRVPRKRLLEVGRPLLPVAAVVVEQPDLEALRDQVLRVAEGDAVVGRRDPEDVRPLRRVDGPAGAVVGDADRDALLLCELPGRGGAGAVREDRDRAGVERAPGVLDSLASGAMVVVELGLECVALLTDQDAATRAADVRGSELNAVL